MKKIFLIVFTVVIKCVSAQQVISSGGNTFVNSQGSISMTIGETFASTTDSVSGLGGTISVVQGFQQSALQTITAIKPLPSSNKLSVFPSPACNKITIQYPSNNILIFDAFGNIVFSLESKSTTISNNTLQSKQLDISHLSSGLYYVKVGSEVKPFFKN